MTSGNKDRKILEPSYTVGEIVKLCSCFGKQFGNYSKPLHPEL
jgi:hypothetical protein